ncbi:hypothetical protein PV326_013415 [Microctonus aethiopoides]|nr:hypothetical protein PV326_013415 [Microctonus aethiopoides]
MEKILIGPHCTVIISDINLNAADVLPSYDTQFMAHCYFPAEFQGEFLMQVSGEGAKGSSNTGEPIQYSVVNITYDAIPAWGRCNKRIGDKVLLVDSITTSF